jgi:drug/metabolite transporter (DMT)-like permease
LVPLAVIFADDLFPSTATGLLWLLLLGLIPQVIGHSSFNYALAHLPASFVTIVILGEPLLSTLLAMVFLDEIPGPWLYVGMPVLLTAVGLASLEEQRRRRAEVGLPEPLEDEAESSVVLSR